MSTPATPTFEALLEHAAFARRLATSLVRDVHGAEDVLQEVWSQSLERPPASSESPRGFLATLIRRAVARDRRAEGRRRDHTVLGALDRGSSEGADAPLERLELSQRLAQLVLALDEPYREAIVLRFFEGESPAVIARLQGVPLETVRTRVKRGLARLREHLDREVPGGREAWLGALAPLARAAPSPGGEATGLGLPSNLGVLAMGSTAKVCLLASLTAAAFFAWTAWHTDADASSSTAVLAVQPFTEEIEGAALPAGVAAQRARTPVDRALAATGRAPAPEEGEAELALVQVEVRHPSGAPASGARVEVRLEPYEVEPDWVEPGLERADAQGRLSLELGEGELRLRAWTEDAWAEAATEPIASGDRLFRELVLQPAGAVEGRVIDAWTGEPIAGAFVEGGFLDGDLAGRSDAGGHYRLGPVPADGIGRPFVARAEGYAEEQVSLMVEEDGSWTFTDLLLRDGPRGTLQVSHLGTEEEDMAGPKSPARVDFHLLPECSIEGEVVSRDGDPISEALVVAQGYFWYSQGLASPDESHESTDADGRFRCGGLRPDIGHTVVVSAPGYARAFVDLGAAGAERRQDAGRIVLQPQAELAGVLRDSSGLPVDGIQVEVRRKHPQPQEPEEPTRLGTRDSYHRSLSWIGTRTDRVGRYRLGGLFAGEYRIRLKRCNRRIWEGELVVGPGEALVYYDLELPPEMGVLHGRLTARGVLPQVLVRLRHDDCVHETAADEDGAFAFWGVDEDEEVVLEARWRDAEERTQARRRLATGADSGLFFALD